MREIAYIGEKQFFYGLSCFTLNTTALRKELLERAKSYHEVSKEDIEYVKQIQDVSLLLQFLLNDSTLKDCFINVCNLICPDFCWSINIEQEIIEGKRDDEENVCLTDALFAEMRTAISVMCKMSNTTDALNPQGSMAKKIAEKMQKSRQKVSSTKGGDKNESALAHYLSLLSIGTHALNLHDTINLTIYQLYNQLERFNLYDEYKTSLSAGFAGAKIEIPDWLKKLD